MTTETRTDASPPEDDAPPWRTIDFRPDNLGLRALYVFAPEMVVEPGADSDIIPVMGWLLQEDQQGDRRVIAAVVNLRDGVLEPVDEADVSFSQLLVPGQPDPTPEEIEHLRSHLYHASPWPDGGARA